MNKENTEKLFNEFKEFFHPEKSLMKSLMGFGFACDDGWYQIIWDLCKKIREELKKNPIEGFEVIQVKEKFGEIRFYVDHGNDQIFKLICEAEKKSHQTCEICGKFATKCTTRHWLKTLCSDCLKNKEFERYHIIKKS